ncbi:MAG: Smr/MutS family protein [Ferruginibacter sp.]
MKYEVGDKIIVLLTEEEATVVEILNEKMLMIDVRGVKFPAYMDQVDFPYFKQFSQKKTEQPKKKIYIDNIKQEKGSSKYKVDEGIWLNFFPIFDKDIFDDDVVEKFKLYLVNQTNDELNFSYALLFGGQNDFELKNTILPLSDFYLHDVAFEDMNDAPRFDFEFTLAKENKRKAAYFETSLKLKAKQIFKKIEEIKLNNEASFSYQLMEKYPDKVEAEKVVLNSANKNFKLYDLSQIGQMLEPARTVVDIHIEKLTDDPGSLSNFEKLSLQLKTFEKYYDLAVVNKQSTLIVVHGIGSGKLRDEIHELLRLKREVKSFVNQYHPSFGYGATEIYFK